MAQTRPLPLAAPQPMKMLPDLPSPKPDHSHCLNCVLLFCDISSRSNVICNMMECEQGCHARFHACKKDEHDMLCQECPVKCINALYGCPFIVPRKHLSSHLQHCPASVYCSAWWNRTQLDKHSDTGRYYMAKNSYMDCAQLDTALAMRDHRVLYDYTRGNNCRQQIYGCCSRVQCIDPQHAVHFVPQWNPTAGSRDSSKSSISRESVNLQLHESEGQRLDVHCGQILLPPAGKQIKCRSVIHDGQLLTSFLNVSVQTNNPLYSPLVYTFQCCQFFRRDEYSQHYDAVHNHIHDGLDGWIQQRCPLAYRGCVFASRRLSPVIRGTRERLTICHSWLQESFGLTICHGDPRQPTPDSLVFPADAPYHQVERHTGGCDSLESESDDNAGIGLTCEPLLSTLTSTLPSPMSPGRTNDVLYTSVNADSYVRVCQPLPNDLSNLEGCMTSHPSRDSPTSTTAVDCFQGSYVFPNQNSTMHRRIDLCCLPTELILHVAEFLDCFSLANLALTCQELRDVCAKLLPNRGMVSLVWSRNCSGLVNTWRVDHKSWSYSSSFGAVDSWQFTGSNPIQQHLMVCPFNQDKSQHLEYVGPLPLDGKYAVMSCKTPVL